MIDTITPVSSILFNGEEIPVSGASAGLPDNVNITEYIDGKINEVNSYLNNGFIKKPLQVSDTFFDNIVAEKTTEEITIDNVKEYFTAEPVIGDIAGSYIAFLHNSTKISMAQIVFTSIDTDGSKFHLASMAYIPKYSVVSELQTTTNNLQNSLNNCPTKSQVNGMFTYDEANKTLIITNLVV